MSVNFLLRKINKQNKEIIIDLICEIINSHRGISGRSILNQEKNKLLGFAFLTKKLKELGFKDEAKKTLFLWLKESPKEIVLNTRHHKESSVFSIEMLKGSTKIVMESSLAYGLFYRDN